MKSGPHYRAAWKDGFAEKYLPESSVGLYAPSATWQGRALPRLRQCATEPNKGRASVRKDARAVVTEQNLLKRPYLTHCLEGYLFEGGWPPEACCNRSGAAGEFV